MSVSTLLNRRRFLYGSTLALGATVSACVAPIQAPLPVEAPVQNPQEALERLLAGNQRYAANGSLPVNESSQRRTEVAQGQQPFATIFSCVDSRVPPELVFDRGLGDLFVIRTAGHVIDEAVIPSVLDRHRLRGEEHFLGFVQPDEIGEMDQSGSVVGNADLGGCHGEGAPLRGEHDVAGETKIARAAPNRSLHHGNDRQRTILDFAQQRFEGVEVGEGIAARFRQLIDVVPG